MKARGGDKPKDAPPPPGEGPASRMAIAQQSALLRRIDELLTYGGGLDSLCQKVVNTLDSAFQEGHSAILLIDAKRERLEWRAGSTPFRAKTEGVSPPATFRVGEGLAGLVAQTGEAILVDDVLSDTRFTPPAAQQLAGGSVLFLPVGFQNECFAVLTIAHPVPHHFREETQETFLLVATHIGRLLTTYRLHATLRETQQRLDLVLFASNFDLWEWDILSGQVWRNGGMGPMRVLGLSKEGQDFQYWWSLIHPEDRPEVQRRLDAHLAGTADAYEAEYRAQAPSGEWRWILGMGQVISRDPQGCPLRMAGAHIDITDRKQAEERLRLSEAKFRSWSESTTAAMIIYRGERTLYVNPAAERITGYEQDELLSMSFLDFIHPEYRRLVIERTASRGQGALMEPHFQVRILRKDGEERWLDFTACTVDFDDQPAYLGTALDITEAKRAQEALKQSEERFRAEYKSIPVPTYTWQWVGADFILADYNDAAFTVTEGYVAQSLGLTASTMYHGMPEIQMELRQCLEQRRPIRREMSYRYQATGITTFLDVTYVFAPPDLVVVHTDDITERKRGEDLMHLLLDSTVQLGATAGLQDSLEIVLGTALKIEGIDAGGIYLMDSGTGELVLAHDRGFTPQFRENVKSYSPDSSQTAFVLEGIPWYGTYDELLGVVRAPQEATGLRAVGIIPIRCQGVSIGSLNLASSTQNSIPLYARKALETLASSLGGVLMRARAQDAEKESRKNLETLFNALEDFLFIADTSGRILNANRSVSDRLGYSLDDLTTMTLKDLHPAERIDEVAEILSEIAAGRKQECLVPLVSRSGEHIPVETHVVQGKWGNRDVLFGISRDIAERKRAEDALRASEEKYRTFVQNSPEPIARVDLDLRYIFGNRMFSELVGLSEEVLIGCSLEIIQPIIHPEDFPRLQADVETVLSTGCKQISDIRYHRPDGTWGWMSHLLYPWYAPDGAMGGLEGVGRDITEKKVAERALRNREAVLEAVAYAATEFLKADSWEERVPDVLARIGQAARVSRVHIFQHGVTADGLEIANHRYEWCAPGIHPEMENLLLQDLPRGHNFHRWETELKAGRSVVGLTRNLHPQEQAILAPQSILSVAVVPIFAGSDLWGVIGCDDCAEEREWSSAEVEALRAAASTLGAAIERKRAERIIAEQRVKMAAAARLTSLGVMASGVAHEINNPLAVISIGAEQLDMLVHSPKQDPEKIVLTASKIRRNVMRIERIIQGLRNLSRDGSGDPFTRRSLRDILNETVDLCFSRFKSHGVELEVEPHAGDLQVDCRSTLLAQVLMNLLSNAYDAVEGTEGAWVRIACVDLDDSVELSVTDSGSGVPLELRERILEPFFTTKDVGKGTGLGLSISKAIMESHHGELLLDGDAPHTRFVLRMPKRQPQNGGSED